MAVHWIDRARSIAMLAPPPDRHVRAEKNWTANRRVGESGRRSFAVSPFLHFLFLSLLIFKTASDASLAS